MLFRLWQFIQMWLPYWLIIWLYKSNRALPANIKTKTGKVLKAIMVTSRYGIIFMDKDYIQNRVKYLKQQQKAINQANADIAREMNSLSFEAREMFFEEDE